MLRFGFEGLVVIVMMNLCFENFLLKMVCDVSLKLEFVGGINYLTSSSFDKRLSTAFFPQLQTTIIEVGRIFIPSDPQTKSKHSIANITLNI